VPLTSARLFKWNARYGAKWPFGGPQQVWEYLVHCPS
jgi:hypothetical protein